MNLPRLEKRRAESHKGDFGLALLIGGSRGMTGAIALAGMAALRGGAGLVKLALPEECLETAAAHEPSYMTVPLPGDGQGRLAAAAKKKIKTLAESATCLACGPGLGRSDDLTELVCWLYHEIDKPLVLDADALNALATKPDVFSKAGGSRILTPHPGEMRRLVGEDSLEPDQLRKRAISFANEIDAVVVLKGHQTLITDGRREAINASGNPGMATGGSGDVLTGLVAALVCQGLGPFEAAQLGVHLHGVAGDLAAIELGQASLIASDLIRFLPRAFLQLDQ